MTGLAAGVAAAAALFVLGAALVRDGALALCGALLFGAAGVIALLP